ncbi:MAG: PIN domain-containing protein [Tildeniella nuda ZEHNDER 1965/U140]|jgi:predicted nucleic acid-binding protein|nr:PIN domain-containing protein [Tildeniella nuda ZEHNDER 1965/U140]
MSVVFADAGYWIALFNPRDGLHTQAMVKAQVVQAELIVTSQMVLAEFLNHYGSMGTQFRQRAVEVVNRLQHDSEVEVVPQTSEQFEQALGLYAQRQDKAWGLIDCASFLIMRERGIIYALAYDEHFRQAGFVPLLRDR